MAKFEVVPLAELKTRLPGKLLPLVEEFKGNLEKLRNDQGGKITLDKGDDAKDIRKALKAAAASTNKRIRFPFRGEEGSVSFYLQSQRGRRKGQRKALAVAKKRGRPKKQAG